MYYNKSMTEVVDNLKIIVDTMMVESGVWAPFLACILILIESIIPILPLFLFISINFIAFGNILGFIISWLFTVLGCMLSFILVKKGFSQKVVKKINKSIKLKSYYEVIKEIKFTTLVLLLTMPFFPAFSLNIIAGIINMSTKKYLLALLIGKTFFVFFWGFIGKSLYESFTDPISLIYVGLSLVLAYIVAKTVKKYYKIID